MSQKSIWILFFIANTIFPDVVPDTVVQLNVNRPFNDVNKNFISFTLKKEDLYAMLDGPNRKSVTSMATMLGEAYIKILGDFVDLNSERKLRSPTKIIWKGFNRWTRHVNWTMIIPVPYTPNNWDSMHTLQILNTSYIIGVKNCIWQLGADFGAARANNYVNELNTLRVMVDAFRPYVLRWELMGADISAGSTVDEIKRYIDLSKNLNAAFGWTQPSNMLPVTSLGSYIYDSDPALRTLLNEGVPVWLTLPQESEKSEQRISSRLLGDETTDALRWAQTIGDAASSGFDVIFKRITFTDWQRPTYSFYITALFKKVMGSRVFPARILNFFVPTNKLYTHCANAVSGGLAFMVVNTEGQPLTITIPSVNKLKGSEIWQYSLTTSGVDVYLNNFKLSLNSSLLPLVKTANSDDTLQLITPIMSVSFWVLPKANLENCHFTEIEADDLIPESPAQSQTSSDRLLQKLIEETSVSRSTFQSTLNRRKRFVSSNHSQKRKTGLDRFIPKFASSSKLPNKQNVQSDRHQLITWLRKVRRQTKRLNRFGQIKRTARSVEKFYGPLFYNKNGKISAFTKSNAEIDKLEKKVKPLKDLSEFNEDDFFKTIGEHIKPEYMHLPMGDIHLRLVDSLNVNEEETDQFITKQSKLKGGNNSNEYKIDNENILHFLPKELYETLPNQLLKPNKFVNDDAAQNVLFYPEPVSINKGMKLKTNAHEIKEHKSFYKGDADFHQEQKELGKKFLSHMGHKQIEQKIISTHNEDEMYKPIMLQQTFKSKNDNAKKYLEVVKEKGAKRNVEKSNESLKTNVDFSNFWWDVATVRKKRSLSNFLKDSELQKNMINKQDQYIPLGYALPEGRYFEYKISNHINKNKNLTSIENSNLGIRLIKETSFANQFISAVKANISKLVFNVTLHVNEWYNDLFSNRPRPNENATAAGIKMETFGNSLEK